MNKNDYEKTAIKNYTFERISGIIVGAIGLVAGIIMAIVFFLRGETWADLAWLFVLIAVIGAASIVVNTLILRSRNK